MHNPFGDLHDKAGIGGGMLGTVLATVNSNDLVKTMVLAATGAVISFGVTFALKLLVRFLRK
jgi:hypothetical protein